jgi:hypothetical protein
VIPDGLPNIIEIRAREMISHLRQIFVTRRYLSRENRFGHKLKARGSLFHFGEQQLRTALIA